MKRIIALIAVAFATAVVGSVYAQRKITFFASDKLEVTADFYLYDSAAPYIILFHKENSSRGEYREIAPKLQKMGFNCLAVDLRSGKESNFVPNETAAAAQKKNIPVRNLLDSEKDMLAAMEYIENTATKNRYIILGSSFSASLAMKVANKNKKVTAVIAYSPGEYFAPLSVKDWAKEYDRLVYVSSTKREQPFVNELLEGIPGELLTKYQQSGDGVHGVQALNNDNPNAGECWMSLLLFVNKVKEENYNY